MTYLEAINSVLVRLRESVVTTPTQTSYSSLIGQLINDTKRGVEDAYAWNALGQLITVTTSAGTSNYTVTGSGSRFKVLEVMNTNNRYTMNNAPAAWITQQHYISNPTNGQPVYYAFSGVDASGDTKVDVYPIPDGTYTLIFNLVIPQAELSSGSTVILAPSQPIVLGAYALALAERGEDQGLAGSEAMQIARNAISDAIAIESSRYIENECWSAA